MSSNTLSSPPLQIVWIFSVFFFSGHVIRVGIKYITRFRQGSLLPVARSTCASHQPLPGYLLSLCSCTIIFVNHQSSHKKQKHQHQEHNNHGCQWPMELWKRPHWSTKARKMRRTMPSWRLTSRECCCVGSGPAILRGWGRSRWYIERSSCQYWFIQSAHSGLMYLWKQKQRGRHAGCIWLKKCDCLIIVSRWLFMGNVLIALKTRQCHELMTKGCS